MRFSKNSLTKRYLHIILILPISIFPKPRCAVISVKQESQAACGHAAWPCNATRACEPVNNSRCQARIPSGLWTCGLALRCGKGLRANQQLTTNENLDGSPRCHLRGASGSQFRTRERPPTHHCCFRPRENPAGQLLTRNLGV